MQQIIHHDSPDGVAKNAPGAESAIIDCLVRDVICSFFSVPDVFSMTVGSTKLI